MWNKISEALSTAWILALIIIAAGVGTIISYDAGLGGFIVFVGVIYLCYTLYWSITNNAQDPQKASVTYVWIVTILVILIILGTFFFMILDANK